MYGKSLFFFHFKITIVRCIFIQLSVFVDV